VRLGKFSGDLQHSNLSTMDLNIEVVMINRVTLFRCVFGLATILIQGGLPSAWAGTPGYQNEVLGDNPVVFYRFNDIGAAAADTSVNGNAGTYFNSPTQNVLGLGISSDSAVMFNGTNQHLSSTATEFGSMMATSSFEFVFKSSTAFPTNKMTLAGEFNTGFATGFQINLNEDAQGNAAPVANSVRFFLRANDAVGVGAAFVNSSILDGNYHHLLFTYNSSTSADRVQAYVDGVPQTVTFGTGAMQSGGTPTNFTDLGFNPAFAARQNRATTDSFFSGTFDEAALYNSTLTATDAVTRALALGLPVPNQWFVDGGGSFNTASNWLTNSVPTTEVVFGGFLTSANAPATVTVNSPVTLNSVKFQSANQYILAGTSNVTLTGSATVEATAGTHQITANLAGTAGLIKTGSGAVELAGTKSYSGNTDVQAGTLLLNHLDAIDNQVSTSLNVGAGGAVQFTQGATGTLAAQLTGSGLVTLGASLGASDTLTINRSNSSFSGLVRLGGGTLIVSNNDALGVGGVLSNRTALDGDSTGKVALQGGVIIASEVLDIDGRSTADAVALTSSGNNSWNGVIDAQGTHPSPQIPIESTSGTLTLNRLHAEDSTAPQTFVFSGAGNTTITGGISEDVFDNANGTITPSTQDNVGVVKRGSGNLTIATGSNGGRVDYWFGPTVIEQGTLTVTDPLASDQGELRSAVITVNNGATLNTTAFGNYSQQIGQTFRGDGTIVASTLALFDDGHLIPGDSTGQIGSLNVTGNVILSDVDAGGVWSYDVGNNTNTLGDTLAVSGTFVASGAPSITVKVTPAHGHLDAGSRAILTHSGGANSSMNSVVAQITDQSGNVLNARQTVSINGSTSGVVNVVVSGEEQTRSWNGNVAGGAWNVGSTNNWQQGDQLFRDLDRVVFDDSATGTTTVAVNGSRFPGSVTFNNSSKSYTLTGSGGIVGTGEVNITGTGIVTLSNTGNDYSGSTNISAGSSLRMTTATTGTINNSGSFGLRRTTTTNAVVQNAAQTIGSGYKVFAVEAESFSSQTNNGPLNSPIWGTITTAPNDTNGTPAENPLVPSLAGQALIASKIAENNLATNSTSQNFVTYSIKFTEPGEYYWFGRMKSVDGGVDLATSNTPDGTSLNDDSLLLPSSDLGNGVADPQQMSTLIDLVTTGGRVVNAEGAGNALNNFDYDWYRSTEGELGGASGFEKIVVSSLDVANGTVFQFKVATRETGMAMDKHVFVKSPDFLAEANFGTLTDADLDAVAVATTTSLESVVSPGSVLNVEGDFNMNGGGSSLSMLLGSPNLHDQINIAGTLAADGVLSFSVGNGGLSAQAGDIFDVLSFGSVTGTFDSIILPTLGSGLGWNTSNLLVTGELAVISVSSPGDFDNDGDVDGRDFLIWQRGGSPNGINSGDLADWQANYGPGALVASSNAVPEPATWMFLLGLTSSLMSVRFDRFCQDNES
jgi:autotransporter-associated beta strand protein